MSTFSKTLAFLIGLMVMGVQVCSALEDSDEERHRSYSMASLLLREAST